MKVRAVILGYTTPLVYKALLVLINVDREKPFCHGFIQADGRGRHAEDAFWIVAEMTEMTEWIFSCTRYQLLSHSPV